jgi:hypothetical protein
VSKFWKHIGLPVICGSLLGALITLAVGLPILHGMVEREVAVQVAEARERLCGESTEEPAGSVD